MVEKWKKDLKIVNKSLKNINLVQVLENILNRQYEKYDIKPLRGQNNLLRIRIGKYRIVFQDIQGEEIRILAIKKRGDVYKGL